MSFDIRLEAKFPRLIKAGYKETSPSDIGYNCIAWSLGFTDRCWWPDRIYFWPIDLPKNSNITAFVKMYNKYGYVICDRGKLEKDFEKVAIYVDKRNIPKHAARQLRNGKWSSKLGKYKDIEHSLEGISGDDYGVPKYFLKRPLKKN